MSIALTPSNNNGQDKTINHSWKEFQDMVSSYALNRLVNSSNRPANKTKLVELKGFDYDAMKLYLDLIGEQHGEADRQHYNCNACRDFINTMGNVYIASLELPAGKVKLRSLLWSFSDGQIESMPVYFRDIAISFRKIYASYAEKATDIYPFFYSKKKWPGEFIGHPMKGDRYHFNLSKIYEHVNLKDLAYIGNANVPLQDYYRSLQYVNDAYNKYKDGAFRHVKELLSSDAVRAEKGHLAALDFYIAYGSIRSKDRIAAAFMLMNSNIGVTHINGGVVGQMLDDVLEGKTNDQIIAHYKSLTRSDVYMRPTKEADEGNIEQANKLIAELGLESALRRRAARLDEVIQHAIWVEPVTQKEVETAKSQGAFDKLRKNKPAQIAANSTDIHTKVDISWAKFLKDILPNAESIKVMLSLNTAYPLCQYVTAADPNAKPIHKWDLESNRNPFSQYVYTNGSLVRHFYPKASELSMGIRAVADFDVVAILPDSLSFNGQLSAEEYNTAGLIVIRDMRDLKNTQSALFPSSLLSSLHSVRATIERYSNTTPLETDPLDNVDDGEFTQKACGLMVLKESKLQYQHDGTGIIVKVKKKDGVLVTTYNIHASGE